MCSGEKGADDLPYGASERIDLNKLSGLSLHGGNRLEGTSLDTHEPFDR